MKVDEVADFLVKEGVRPRFFTINTITADYAAVCTSKDSCYLKLLKMILLIDTLPSSLILGTLHHVTIKCQTESL